MSLLQVLLLFLCFQLDLFFLIRQLLGGLLKLHLLLFDLVLKTLDLLIVFLHRLLQLHIARLLLQVNVGLEVLDALLDGVQVFLLDKDLAMQDVCLLQLRRLLLHREACKSSVDTNREKLGVVVVKAHALDLLSVGLHFKHLLHRFITFHVVVAVAEDLNGARAVGLGKTSVEHVALSTDKDLRVSQILLVAKQLLATVHGFVVGVYSTADLPNGAIAASSVHNWLLLALRLVASDRAITGLRMKLEAPGRVLLILLRVQTPYVDLGILTARDETRVVLEPSDTLDRLLMHHKFEVSGDRCRVELVHPDVFIVLACEILTTVSENNLAALLDRQTLVLD